MMMGGVVEDTVDAVKRGGAALRDRAGAEVERMKQRIAEERQRRMLRLMVFVGVAYLLWRRA